MIFFLVEEPSIRPVIEALMGKLAPTAGFKIIPHEGKDQLRAQIPKVVPTLAKVPGARLMVIHDQDRAPCLALKQELLALCGQPGSPLLVRIACQELEAWFLGDLAAVSRAYPRFSPARVQNKARLREVDAIEKPSLELHRVVPELSKLPFLPKREVARAVAPHLDPTANRSPSFRCLVAGILNLAT